jgi:hypothetical protein
MFINNTEVTDIGTYGGASNVLQFANNKGGLGMTETMSGSVLMKGRSRIVAVGGYTMDMIPEGYVIVSRHLDIEVLLRFTTTSGPNISSCHEPRCAI